MKNKKTVLIGMSGGVDSSVVALLLKNQGYNIIGIFMKNFSDTKNKLTNQCSWIEERNMAKKIAAMLNIPLITIDYEEKYKNKVINPMFKSYSKGLTPNPDTLCNKIIKFPALWKKARQLKADYIATGHYARIRKTKNKCQLLQGKDKTKDQSYFLHELSQSELSHILFPLGNSTKSQVRKIAKEHNFPNHNKPGTKGICFIGKINMLSFLRKNIKPKKGKILDTDGNLIGYHPGIMYYTIGQRVGPRLDFDTNKQFRNKFKDKLYIAEKRKGNILVIAPKNHPSLKRKKVIIKNLHLTNPKAKIPKANIKARIRHLGPLNPGKLIKQKDKFSFIFNKPLEGLAEGQSIVLYKGSQLIGGGEMRLS